MEKYKIAVLGLMGSGRSSITLRYLKKEFYGETDPTIEEEYETTVTIDDQDIGLTILDNAGGEELSYSLKEYFQNGHGIIIVFSLTNMTSFLNCESYIRLFESVTNRDAKDHPILLLGNKKDLEEKRCVPVEKTKDFQKRIKAHYWEVSALTGENVDQAINEFVKAIRNQYTEKDKQGYQKNNAKKSKFKRIFSRKKK
ncbi:ras [Anaeramoeba flamelloides]|uniref:Ras n=1 Tax=Anaeramoeba flamelloides TaxID=1746091 RepID=A0ABQ8YNJ7_9EUKA|nr:ras [Anaeramoeba flamelloides]